GKVRYRPIIMLIVSGIALISAIVIGTAITILNLRASALVGSERELPTTALLIAKHADHEIEELDAVQNSLIEEMRSLGNVSSEDFQRKMSGVDVHSMLKHKISGLSHIGSVALINSDGMLTNTSLEWPFPAINAADRNYFKAFKSDAQLTSFVSEPIRGRRTGNWTIVFARKITAPNGEFLGVVGGTIDLQYFENFFESVILGEGGSISLFRNDGTLLVRYRRAPAWNDSVSWKDGRQGPPAGRSTLGAFSAFYIGRCGRRCRSSQLAEGSNSFDWPGRPCGLDDRRHGFHHRAAVVARQ